MTQVEGSDNLHSGRVVEAQGEDALIDAMTQELLKQAILRVTSHGEFHLVLRCNESLDKVYARLMYDPDLRAMPWANTHLWFMHGESDESIVMHSGIPEEHVHVCKQDEELQQKIDCCVMDSSDVMDTVITVHHDCEAIIILAQSQPTSCSVDWTPRGVAHWFFDCGCSE